MFDTEKGLYQRIFSFFFDEQNFWKALPVLIAPSIIIGIISFSLANLLSSDLKNTKIDVEYNIIFIPISVLGGLIILWILFGNSLYFRLSLYNLIAIANISLFCYLTIYLGGTFGDNLFLYPPAVIFALFMIVYTINSVRRPIELLNEGTNKAATGNLDIEEKNIGIYGMEFAHLEKSFLSMMRNIALILTSAQKTTEKLSSYSVDFVTMFAAVEAMSAEISDNVQEVIQGATNQADVAQKGIDSIKTMSQLVENALRDIENTTQVIEGIAKQTNMLSLNASIEAARAGEYGRGFGVVAENIGSLAEETKQHAANISDSTVKIIDHVFSSLATAQETFYDFVAQSESFTTASREIAAQTKEQGATLKRLMLNAQELSQLSKLLTSTIVSFNADDAFS